MKTDAKTQSLWQKTRCANLVRNLSSGKYFARFRHNGKLIWRGFDKGDVKYRFSIDMASLQSEPVSFMPLAFPLHRRHRKPS
jgi:hypothetical protein